MQRSQKSREIQWLLEEKYRGRLTSSTKRDIARLQKGEHVDYVIGFVDFLGCKIDLSLRPFIPRPETEYWVEKTIQDIRSRSAHIKCLDLFAGSGCIGIAVLKACPEFCRRVDFGEKDKRLLSQIRLNAKKNGIEKKRYRVLQSDVFSNIKGRYKYIFANPPYIAESRKRGVQSSVLKNEPPGALFAGKRGLAYIKIFLKEAKSHLNSGGKIYMEFDSYQKAGIENLLRRYEYGHWEFFKDQYAKWRCVEIVYNGKHGSRKRTSRVSEG